jgi:hypothetical protein
LGLAAATSLASLVGTKTPVRERTAQVPVEPAEPLEHISLRNLSAPDPALIAHDEAAVELRTRAGQPLGHVRHENGITPLIENGTVVSSEDERPTPVEKETPATHGRTVARVKVHGNGAPYPRELHENFMVGRTHL